MPSVTQPAWWIVGLLIAGQFLSLLLMVIKHSKLWKGVDGGAALAGRRHLYTFLLVVLYIYPLAVVAGTTLGVLARSNGWWAVYLYLTLPYILPLLFFFILCSLIGDIIPPPGESSSEPVAEEVNKTGAGQAAAVLAKGPQEGHWMSQVPASSGYPPLDTYTWSPRLSAPTAVSPRSTVEPYGQAPSNNVFIVDPSEGGCCSEAIGMAAIALGRSPQRTPAGLGSRDDPGIFAGAGEYHRTRSHSPRPRDPDSWRSQPTAPQRTPPQLTPSLPQGSTGTYAIT